MKGIVFSLFNQLVEDKFGMEVWEQLLDKVQPESDGVYTTVGTYNDSEMLALVGALSEITNVPIPDLVRVFGEYLAHQFHSNFPDFYKENDLRSFLKSIHGVIHVEVNKLYPDSYTPDVICEDLSDDVMMIRYSSKRKLCPLLEGLVSGTAGIFNTPIDMKKTQCMADGHDECHYEVTFKEAKAA